MNNVFFPPRLLALLGVGAAGCAIAQTLHAEASAAAMLSAETSGALGAPLAALHLQLAREELQTADSLSRVGHGDEAYSRRLRARVALSCAEQLRADEVAMAGPGRTARGIRASVHA